MPLLLLLWLLLLLLWLWPTKKKGHKIEWLTSFFFARCLLLAPAIRSFLRSLRENRSNLAQMEAQNNRLQRQSLLPAASNKLLHL